MKRTYITVLMLAAGFVSLGCDTCGRGNDDGWEYQFETVNPGTRSEFVVGRLRYKEAELPARLQHVVTPVGEFTFVAKLPWADRPPGWVPATENSGGVVPHFREADVKAFLAGEKGPFRSTAAKQPAKGTTDAHAIAGRLEARPAQAGPRWFYALKHAHWIDPEKLAEALGELEKK